jgi:hypothetical protein
MPDASIIEREGRALAEAAQSPARVILFGSGARGDADAGSDPDFLVIESSVEDRIGKRFGSAARSVTSECRSTSSGWTRRSPLAGPRCRGRWSTTRFAMGGSSPSPEQIEVAELLMRRAESDVRACRRLAGDPEMDDDVVGFHAQQAVEKAVKVALILRGVDFRTHDLDFLIARAGAVGWARSMLGR